jgi:hypothetical protein
MVPAIRWGENGVEPVLAHELAATGDVLPDVGDQALRMEVSHAELRSPAHQHRFAIRQ